MPIELFGKSVNKVLLVAIGLLLSENGIVVLDDIETSIHHYHYTFLWELIFKWSNLFNIQVFASTCSQETYNSFNTVALQRQHQITACNIKMNRRYKSNQIYGTAVAPNLDQESVDGVS
jgi:AAA15 family ATPase/GTPase